MGLQERTEAIDRYLNGYGDLIVEEARGEHVGLPLGCALVEQESGGRNIFGCDWGSKRTWEPPFCQIPVTRDRVQMLISHAATTGESNGVGLTQLTYLPLILQAEDLGGAHRPRIQLRVGFRLLARYLQAYDGDVRKALGVYNGGPKNPNYYYAESVLVKREVWRARLGL